MPDEMKELFSDEHLAVIERALKDPVAFAVLMESRTKLEEIVREAKRRGLSSFKCHLGLYPSFPMKMCFEDYEGHRYKVSMSFRRAYEKNRPFFDMETALSLGGAVESLVLSVDGIRHMSHIRTRKNRAISQ
jgi:hypothetical protein